MCAIDYLWCATRRLARDIRGIDLDGGQTLTQLIVKLARQPPALLLFGLDDPAIEIASLRSSFLHGGCALVESQRYVIDVLETESRQAGFQVSGLEIRQRGLYLRNRFEPLAHHPIEGRTHGEEDQCQHGEIAPHALLDFRELRHRVG